MNIYQLDQDATYLMLTDISRASSYFVKGKSLVTNIRGIRNRFNKDIKLPKWAIESGYIRVQLDLESCIVLKSLSGAKLIDTYEEKFKLDRIWIITKHVVRDIFHEKFFPFKPRMEPVKIRRRS